MSGGSSPSDVSSAKKLFAMLNIVESGIKHNTTYVMP
jgi:hypothetical protein